MHTKDISQRRDKILGMIIDTYINTAEPIASRTISRRLRLGLSPATVRNVMADLEETGLIAQPHTSAGRIPTEKGYRYYIDKLMNAVLLTEEEKKVINKQFKEKINEINEIVDKAAEILSQTASQAGIALFPMLQKGVFKHIEIVKLDRLKILVVLIGEAGFVNDFVIQTKEDIPSQELARIANFINSSVQKGSLLDMKKEIMQRMIAEKDAFFYILQRAKAIIEAVLEVVKENRIYLEGRAYIAQQPEFSNAQKLKGLFKKLEDKEFLFSLLCRGIDEKYPQVYIGSEIDQSLSDCSLITSTYCIGGVACGTLGLIGPTRMEYAKMVAIVDYVASALSKCLSEE